MLELKTNSQILTEMQSAGFNVTTCGNCGHVRLHHTGVDELRCETCNFQSDVCDFPDLFDTVSEPPIGKVVTVDASRKSVFDMDQREFTATLESLTTPDEVFNAASDIYKFMSDLFKQPAGDSTLREWAFQWWTDKTGRSYDDIYNKWLGV